MLFALSLILVLVAVGGYFGLGYLVGQGKKEYDDLSVKLSQAKTPDQIALEDTVLGYKQRLQDFSTILNAHTAPSRFFASLDNLAYPSVYFDNVTVNPIDKTATISGKVDTFESLAKQVLVLRNAAEVFDSINLMKINLGQDGNVAFSFAAKIKPDAILYK